MVSHGPVKVFADSFPESEKYDKNSNLEIERVSGFKIFRKYRKANLIHEFLRKNNTRAIFFDHWKSLEIIYEDIDLLVINKPAGIIMHPGAGNYDKTIVNALIHYNKDSLSNIGKTLSIASIIVTSAPSNL